MRLEEEALGYIRSKTQKGRPPGPLGFRHGPLMFPKRLTGAIRGFAGLAKCEEVSWEAVQ